MLENFGRYQLIKKLATGGMGQVYLARQKGPVGFEKLVVVKRILPHISEEEEFIQMFFDEARIAAHLNHPNIAQIYDLGEVEGTYYIAMEYVQGESLRSVNTRANAEKGGVPLGLKCRIIAEAASALDFAHHARSPSGKALSLIHRDVSPQNVLVGFNGSVKLIDFGVAKAAGKISTTLAGAIKGKYAYMSPEQAKGEELDQRSDIFGLGIIFYEILTNTRLFKRESETATLKAVVTAKVPLPSSLVSDIPKELDAIALKALAKRRQDRYQTAGELELAIEDFLVENRMSATSAHLAAFMRDLYAKEISQEKVEVEPSQPDRLEPRGRQKGYAAKSSSATGGAPLSRSASRKGSTTKPAHGVSQSASESMASISVSHTASLSGSVSKRTVALTPRKKPTLATEEVSLDKRLSAVRSSDTVRGLFFNAVLSGVSRFAGPNEEPNVLAATGFDTYQDASNYPTGDFLKLLWKAAEVCTKACEGKDRAFFQLGVSSMDSLLRSSLGHSLEQLSRARDAHWLLTPLLASLGPLLRPGERSVEGSSDHGAHLTYRRDLLPPPFHVGFLTQALSKLRGVNAAVDVTRRGGEETAYEVLW